MIKIRYELGFRWDFEVCHGINVFDDKLTKLLIGRMTTSGEVKGRFEPCISCEGATAYLIQKALYRGQIVEACCVRYEQDN